MHAPIKMFIVESNTSLTSGNGERFGWFRLFKMMLEQLYQGLRVALPEFSG
jgi:hypothetical protein